MIKSKVRTFIVSCVFALLIIAAGAGNSIIAAGTGQSIVAPGSGSPTTMN